MPWIMMADFQWAESVFTRPTMHKKTALKCQNLHYAELTEAWNA